MRDRKMALRNQIVAEQEEREVRWQSAVERSGYQYGTRLVFDGDSKSLFAAADTMIETDDRRKELVGKGGRIARAFNYFRHQRELREQSRDFHDAAVTIINAAWMQPTGNVELSQIDEESGLWEPYTAAQMYSPWQLVNKLLQGEAIDPRGKPIVCPEPASVSEA